VDPDALRAEDTSIGAVVKLGEQRVLTVTDDDATLAGIESRLVLVSIWTERIRRAMGEYRADRAPDALRRGGMFVAVGTVVLALALFGVRRLQRRLKGWLDARLDNRLTDLRIQSVSLIQAKQIAGVVRSVVRAFMVALWILLIFLYLEFALSRFVWTRPFAERTIGLVRDPLLKMRDGVLDALPGLAFVAVLALVVYWLLRVGRIVFDAVESGAVKLSGFEAEWAGPTFRILRTVTVLFSMVIAYPYLPGASSEAFKGISVFIGVMLSLGAASMIGNLLAGYSMIYRRAFRVGDRIKVGDDVGDVTHIRAMVTHLRTMKNEEIIVPNSRLLGEQVVNYSSLARTDGLILHTTVGIGYETPWRQVEAMLLIAAGRTENIMTTPAPFVLHKSLGDFCVVYELNVYVDNAQGMARTYTSMHRNILDVFNEYGVQIMTPAYEGDPEEPKLVPRSQWFAAPARAAGEPVTPDGQASAAAPAAASPPA
ncbi:MAG TPA: mechanosensitive ion channel domain-containing protein, partial [Quisquiliibacterium sp.]|nr:mechanosensitive ion channel domain-containing protein [Quisquiliibacterium sp.]